MSGRARFIDIDRIVLDGVDPRRVAGLGPMLEARIADALVTHGDARIAHEAARAVMASITDARPAPAGAADGS